MNDPNIGRRIQTHVETSVPFNIASPPGVYTNGRRVRIWGSPAFWQAVLEAPDTQPASEAATLSATTTRASSA